jgi:crotonobetainyl-CoA:carnitine CoA-transferase CaiB-like acyl-CoA transferase
MTQHLWDQSTTRDDNQAGTQFRSHAGALSRLIVLDCSDSISGQFCARLLADYGASVTLVEPPVGSPTRQMPPFDKHSEQSLLFFHLNTGKRSITLDRSAVQGAALWAELIAEADVVVLPPGEHGAPLRAINPRLVTASISPLGTTGPLADWRATEMILQALSGMMHNNGDAGREPLYGCGQRASYAAGLAGYIGTLAALYARGRGAPGQDVTIDAAETATSMCFPYVFQHIYNGAVRSRGEQNSPVGQVRCRDGWVCIWIYNHRFVVAMKALGLDELVEDSRFSTPSARQEHWPELIALIQEHIADRGADDLVADMQAANVIAARSSRPTDLYRDSHLAMRDFWETVDTPEGPRPILGAPYRLSRTPRYVTGPAPALGADNDSVVNRREYDGAARGQQKAGVA